MWEVVQLEGNILRETAERFCAGESVGDQLTLALLASVLFYRGDEEGSFMALEAAGETFVPLYSSEWALAVGEGPCKWFTGHGQVLVPLIPPGVGLVIDLGSPHEITLAAWAINHDLDSAERSAEESSPGQFIPEEGASP
jgi:hypothetical protein